MARLTACRSLQTWREGVSESARVDMSHPLASGMVFLWLAQSGYDSAIGPYGRVIGQVDWILRDCGLAMHNSNLGGFSAHVSENTILRLRRPYTICWVGVADPDPGQFVSYACGYHNNNDQDPWICGGVGTDYNRYARMHGNDSGYQWQYNIGVFAWEVNPGRTIHMWLSMDSSGYATGGCHNNVASDPVAKNDPTYSAVGSFGVNVQEGAWHVTRASTVACAVWTRVLTVEELREFRDWYSTLTLE